MSVQAIITGQKNISMPSITATGMYIGTGTSRAALIDYFNKPLANCNWADISEISSLGIADSIFDIGELKEVSVSGTIGTLSVDTTLYAKIQEFNHNSGNEGSGINWSLFYSSSGNALALVDSSYNSTSTTGKKAFNMNHWGNYNIGGWGACDMRYDILGSTNVAPSGYGSARVSGAYGTNPTNYDLVNYPVSNTLMAALPSALRAVLKPMSIKTDNKGGGSGSSSSYVTTSIDYLALYSIFEVNSDTLNGYNSYEQSGVVTFDEYASDADRIVYSYADGVTAVKVWTRTCVNDNDRSFGYINTNGSAWSSTGAYRSQGIMVRFLV